MNFETYFPEQRHLLAMTTIRRERLLPQDAIGDIETRSGGRVDLHDVVVRGSLPSRFVIVEAGQFFGFRNPDDLNKVLLVEEHDIVEERQVIAGKPSGRGKKLLSPVTGVVAYIGEGRIIIEDAPETIELEAGLIGQVVGVHESRGVTIETVGAVLQGVWGNNRLVIGTLRAEPEAGLETIYGNQIDMQYRGAIVVTRRPLKEVSLQVIEDQGLSGVIAPTMDLSLLDLAQGMQSAVLLTEGFGAQRMSQFVYSFLESLNGKQATLDASLPDRFERRRPEVIVNLPARAGQRPPQLNLDIRLQPGMNVRLTRGQNAGAVGQVVHLPKTPYLLDNGLRVACAQVQLTTGESVFAPLANLEVFGQ